MSEDPQAHSAARTAFVAHAAKSVFVPALSIQNAPAAASPLVTHVHWAAMAAVALGVQVDVTGATAGQVTAVPSVKAPELPHVYVVVAGVPPTVAALVQVKMIVDPAASVAPAAAGAVPVASPPVLAAVV